MDKRTINNRVVLLSTFPRTGGTLISKALRHHPDILLVSEVHPDYTTLFPLSEQLEKWFEIIPVGDYKEDLNSFVQHAMDRGKVPVIRDFCYNDFIDLPEGKEPQMTNLDILEKLGYEVVKIGLVRNAFDVWLSQNTPRAFAKQFLLYTKSLVEYDFQIFKYEDLILNPEKTISKILNLFALETRSDLFHDLINIEGVTGDISNDYQSRAFGKDGVLNFGRRPIPLAKIGYGLWNKQMKEANVLLGYEPSIFAAKFEGAKIKLG